MNISERLGVLVVRQLGPVDVYVPFRKALEVHSQDVIVERDNEVEQRRARTLVSAPETISARETPAVLVIGQDEKTKGIGVGRNEGL